MTGVDELINLADETGHETEVNCRAAWNELQRAFLVELLVEFNRPGTRLQNAWSSVAWNEMNRRFKAKFSNANFSVKQLKEQERTLKKQYKAVQKLLEQSGFGWDPTRKMVTAPQEVWLPLLEKDKEARKWYNKAFPYYEDLHGLYSGVIATGSLRSGTNRLANHENPIELDSPNPTIPAPGDSNQFEIDDDFSNTPIDDPLSTQVPSSMHAPPRSQTPNLTENNSSRPKSKSSRKRKAMSEFHEEYLAYKREETRAYCAQMEKNSKRSSEREEQFSIAAAMDAYQKLPEFDILDFIYASEMFMGDPKICEAFISCHEGNRAVWIKQLIERFKAKQ